MRVVLLFMLSLVGWGGGCVYAIISGVGFMLLFVPSLVWWGGVIYSHILFIRSILD